MKFQHIVAAVAAALIAMLIGAAAQGAPIRVAGNSLHAVN